MADSISNEFPAHAGMNRRPPPPLATATGVPRTRGDEPRVFATDGTDGDEFPAHAGMNLNADEALSLGLMSSPHTRG